jgi:hypothetical protein
MWYSTKQSPLCCGVLQFGRYKFIKPTYQSVHIFIELTGNELDRFSYGQAEFSDDPVTLKENAAAFEELCQKFDLVYKTEPRLNKAHQAEKKNKLFMAIFQAKKKQ